MVVAPPSDSAPAFPADRAFLRDLGKAYLAFGLGLPIAVRVVDAFQLYDDFSARAAVALGPLALLIIFLGYRARSKGFFVARATGAYAGWLSFLVVGSIVHFDQLIGSFRVPSVVVALYAVVVIVVGLIIAAGMVAGDLFWILLRRRRQSIPLRHK